MHTANKNRSDRRRFLTTTVAAGVAAAAGPWLQPRVLAADQPKERIKIGQIGTEHEHVSGKMATFRKLTEHYEVVGIVEGMHIHLDKPGGETIAPFKKMLDEAGRRGLTVQLGYMYRNNPAVQFCFRAVREGWLGRVFEVDAVMNRQDSLAYRNWLKATRKCRSWSVCTPCSRSWLNDLTAHRPPPRPPPLTHHRGRRRRTSSLRLEVHFARHRSRNSCRIRNQPLG